MPQEQYSLRTTLDIVLSFGPPVMWTYVTFFHKSVIEVLRAVSERSARESGVTFSRSEFVAPYGG
jgi:hypothetical protein